MRAVVALVLMLTGCASVGPVVVEGALAGIRRSSGLEERTYLVDFFRVRAFERPPASPDEPLIVFVHGYTGDASNWDRLVPLLPRAWGVLVPELPGHGETTPRQRGRGYDVSAQAERLVMLLEQRGRARVHLVGNSMGGHIAALVAARYPERVASLTLVDAAGVTPLVETEAWRRARKGENPYRVTNREEFRAFLELVFHEPPDLPDLALDYALAQRQASEAWNKYLRDDLGGGWVPMEPLLGRIRTPTLITWGDDDRVIHPSCAEVYRRGIAGSEKVLLQDCGHTPAFECPRPLADALVPFIRRAPAR